jgi:hypothetical protein
MIAASASSTARAASTMATTSSTKRVLFHVDATAVSWT